MSTWVRILLGSCLLLALAGCRPAAGPASAGGAAPAGSAEPVAITVAAAADLQFAFTDIARLYEQETGNQVTLVFGSTGQLVQQIENGAPFDLIAAANLDYVRRLEDQGLVAPDSVALYAQGRIVLAVNAASGVEANSLPDLLSPAIRRVVIANPDHAPYGMAAREALQAAGVWEAIQGKLILAENVRQALQYLQTGDVDAGIIALSVAYVPEIRWTLIDGDLHQPLDQALAVIAGSQHPDTAAQFARLINGEKGRPVMRRYGFILPGEAPLPTSQPDLPSTP